MNYSFGLKPACLLLLSISALAQPASEFTPLFEDGSLDGWTYENTETGFFSLEDGVLIVTGNNGWLRSPRDYGDFVLRGEFRFVTENADSGIFLRQEAGTDFIRGWPGDSYQVQIRDISVNSTDSPLPLVHLYRHRVPDGETAYERSRVFELYSGVDQWQDIEITVSGDELSVRLNDETVTRADTIVNPRGHIGFQSEVGRTEYRNMVIYAP